MSRSRRRLEADVQIALARPDPIRVIDQPRSLPGDDPELWSDRELGERIRRHLRRVDRGESSLAATREFGTMMDEQIERDRAGGATGTRDQLWEAVLARHR